MKTIRIGKKEYPFILSAAAAKQYFKTLNEGPEEKNIEASIDKQINVIHQGMLDASLSNTWWERNITKRVPARQKIERLISANEMNNVIAGIFPTQKQEGGADSEEKKNST